MSANEHLSQTQFQDIPLSSIVHVPIPHESLMEGEWAKEHVSEYAQHGGSAGYVQHLAQSMKTSGQQEAVELRANGDGTYDIWDGNHRVAAAHAAGLPSVRALVE